MQTPIRRGADTKAAPVTYATVCSGIEAMSVAAAARGARLTLAGYGGHFRAVRGFIYDGKGGGTGAA